MTVSFHIDYLQMLSPEGELAPSAWRMMEDEALLLRLYRAMTLTRIYDGKAIALQRTGQLGTFSSSLGQEAIGVGMAEAMAERDVLAPSYRDHGAQFMRGVTMVENLLYWGGDERGSNFASARADFPICVPVGTHVAHAVGAAYAFKLRKEDRVAVCSIGDGCTANGGFYEALNMAGVWRAPCVVVINNNRWAISTPLELESATQTLAQKAIAAGVEGRQVDGNDVIAMYEVMRQAMEKARQGGGPTLIEALSYRLGDHTTADDATRYRDPDIVRQEWTREPISRMRKFLTAKGLWTKEQESALLAECAKEVEKAVEGYLATPSRGSDAIFDHVFETMPALIQRQRDAARRFAGTNGARHD